MKKCTKVSILAGVGLYIVYDIIALAVGGASATLSHVIYTWIGKLPFISYAIMVVIFHFYSFVRVKIKNNHRYLIAVSIFMLLLNFAVYIFRFEVHTWFTALIGAVVGTCFWSQNKGVKK